ncbi:MAG: hypothetical protein BWY76_00334 [bacterium ADurb.Bin429]|nr:MAG: hypothetical protein BWY76_00334 [bacterium ADurb.Bin429]
MSLGMYIHMHWGYRHPYAARTWSLEDWRGYAEGLKALGYNLVMIWPMTDSMPDPLTPSDRAHLEKIRAIIAMLHELGMTALVTAGPNCLGNNVAAQYPFESRPFFAAERRINPADPAEVAALLDFHRRLLEEYLGEADGLVIIDSDPGGYIGSTNREFLNLLLAHQAMMAGVNPRMTLYYWMWVGWEQYNKSWEAVRDGLPVDYSFSKSDCAEVVAGLLEYSTHPWAVLTCSPEHHEVVREYDIADRALFNPYGAVEIEPAFPLTNFAPFELQQRLKEYNPALMRLGAMANAQTHVAQLPQTYLFAHYAHGGARRDADLRGFADGLIPGCGELLVEAWETLGSDDPARMRAAAGRMAILHRASTPGPLGGLLFGDPERYLEDLVLQLTFLADLLDFNHTLELPALTRFADAFIGPVRELAEPPLRALRHPAIDEVFAVWDNWREPEKRHGIVTRMLEAIAQVIE